MQRGLCLSMLVEVCPDCILNCPVDAQVKDRQVAGDKAWWRCFLTDGLDEGGVPVFDDSGATCDRGGQKADDPYQMHEMTQKGKWQVGTDRHLL